MFVRVEHAVLGGVCSMPTSVSSPTHAALSFAQYIYGVYLGLNSTSRHCTFDDFYLTHFPAALPFLVRTELLLVPLFPLFVGYIVSLLGFNVAKHALPLYFGS